MAYRNSTFAAKAFRHMAASSRGALGSLTESSCNATQARGAAQTIRSLPALLACSTHSNKATSTQGITSSIASVRASGLHVMGGAHMMSPGAALLLAGARPAPSAGSMAAPACPPAGAESRALHTSNSPSAAGGSSNGAVEGSAGAEDGEEESSSKHKHRTAKSDPFSQLLASRGKPLGVPVEDARPVLDEVLSNASAAAVAASLQRGAEAGAPAAADAWGTTSQSPAEIARRIMDTNKDVAEGDDPLPPVNPGGLDNDDLVLPEGQARYKTLEALSADIKALDEVFEVLAQVPWIDEGDLGQKELKGVAMVGLLGTLEEVGFDIRTQVERIWAGEHDESLAMGCKEAKDQAALISILFHTRKLVEQYGKAPPCYPKPFEGLLSNK